MYAFSARKGSQRREASRATVHHREVERELIIGDKEVPMSEEPRTPSPGPKAGQIADDEDHQLTDEERMLLEIDQLKVLIDALPNDASDDVLNRAPHLKTLGRLEFQCHLSVERKRVARGNVRRPVFGAVFDVSGKYPCPCGEEPKKIIPLLWGLHLHGLWAGIRRGDQQMSTVQGTFLFWYLKRQNTSHGIGRERCRLGSNTCGQMYDPRNQKAGEGGPEMDREGSGSK